MAAWQQPPPRKGYKYVPYSGNYAVLRTFDDPNGSGIYVQFDVKVSGRTDGIGKKNEEIMNKKIDILRDRGAPWGPTNSEALKNAILQQMKGISPLFHEVQCPIFEKKPTNVIRRCPGTTADSGTPFTIYTEEVVDAAPGGAQQASKGEMHLYLPSVVSGIFILFLIALTLHLWFRPIGRYFKRWGERLCPRMLWKKQKVLLPPRAVPKSINKMICESANYIEDWNDINLQIWEHHERRQFDDEIERESKHISVWLS